MNPVSSLTSPSSEAYLDEAAVRGELTRVFDVCASCRRCVDRCSSFPTLFEMIDEHDDGEAGLLTPAQQDRVVDACFNCSLCVVGCPYGPGVDDAAVDVPSLMLRAVAMQRANGHQGGRTKIAAKILAKPARVGLLASKLPAVANRVVASEPNSLLRKVMARVTGLSPKRRLAAFAPQRFSKWFAGRPRITMQKRQAEVTLYPTCLVEYQAVDVGKDLVKVYERNGIECGISKAGCCGAALLHSGDVRGFVKVARKNVATLAAEIRRGGDVVVPQPTCASILIQHYVAHLEGTPLQADAEFVAARTHDANAFLMDLHRGDDYVLDTDFEGHTNGRIAYHASSHVRARGTGFPGRDLMKLTGARVQVVQQSAGVEGIWALRHGNEAATESSAERLNAMLDRVGADVVAGDCHFANNVISERTGTVPTHPLQIIARAYGIPEEL